MPNNHVNGVAPRTQEPGPRTSKRCSSPFHLMGAFRTVISRSMKDSKQIAEVAAFFKTPRIEEETVIDYFTDTHFAGGNTPSNRLALAVDAAGEEDRI